MDLTVNDALAKSIKELFREEIIELVHEELSKLRVEMQTENRYITSADVMQRLQIKRTCLWSLEKKGLLIPVSKLGGTKLYREFDVEELLRKKGLKYYTIKNIKNEKDIRHYGRTDYSESQSVSHHLS